jgi:hypothetical protein
MQRDFWGSLYRMGVAAAAQRTEQSREFQTGKGGDVGSNLKALGFALVSEKRYFPRQHAATEEAVHGLANRCNS